MSGIPKEQKSKRAGPFILKEQLLPKFSPQKTLELTEQEPKSINASIIDLEIFFSFLF